MRTVDVLNSMLGNTDIQVASMIAELLVHNDLLDNCNDLIEGNQLGTAIKSIWLTRVLPAYTIIKKHVDKINVGSSCVVYDDINIGNHQCLHGQIEWRDYFLMALIALGGNKNE